MVVHLKHILLLLVASISLFAQSNKNIEQKNNELKGIKSKIIELENELKSKKVAEVQNVKLLDKINYQSHLLHKVIKGLDVEEKGLEKKINKLSTQINELKIKLADLKLEYAKYVKWLYINGKESKWNYLIKSNSINQALVRYKYFNYITENNNAKVKQLAENKDKLEKLSLDLKSKNYKKQKVEKEKRVEISRLNNRRDEKTELIAKLKTDKNYIEKEIDEKRKYETEIKTRIAKLIELEREKERKFREERFKNKSVEPSVPKINYAKFENFSELKGKMNWPVSVGKIVRKFGENKNKKLKTVTLNYGIDIRSKSDEKVFAVAEGAISVIDWIVGFGSIIIITHKGDFRTVYGHIDNIQVNEGDIVKAGTELGTVNRSLEGDIIHFEIWDERNYQNPQKWLVKK